MSLPPVVPSSPVGSAWSFVGSPVARVGGALLLAGLLAASLAPARTPSSYRLVLDAPTNPRCVYGSAWAEGDVVLAPDVIDRALTLTSRYEFRDGCTWEATEALTPSTNGYDYAYREHIVECRADARPGKACPRDGHVHLVANQR